MQISVTNLGSWFDSQLNMSVHISKLCAAAFYHLHNISRIRRFLGLDSTTTLIRTLGDRSFSVAAPTI